MSVWGSAAVVGKARKADRSSSTRDLLSWLVPPLLMVIPLVVFLRHHQHSVLAAESLMCLLALLGCGVVVAAAAELLGDYARVPLYGLLITLLFDFLTEIFDGSTTRLALAFILVTGLAFGLRRHLVAVVGAFGVTVLLSSLLFPVGAPREETFVGKAVAANAAAPPLVHIVLDEMIGVEAIPAEHDARMASSSEIKSFFLSRGFDVYGKAYAVSAATRKSLASALNFVIDRRQIGKRFGDAIKRKHVGLNAYFSEMTERGYRLHVYQSDYIDFCRDGAGRPLSDALDACFTYSVESPAVLGMLSTEPMTKARLLAAMYSKQSYAVTNVRFRYALFQLSPRGRKLGLPPLQALPKMSSISARPVFDRLADGLAEVEPGHLYFAHLLLPHYPYAFDANCVMRPDFSKWLGIGSRNTEAARARRYAMYLEQVQCTLDLLGRIFDRMDAAGRFAGARVIVHGDHGSRIQRGEKTPANDIDKFATLFAHRPPHASAPGNYETVLAPINVLLPEVLRVEGKGLAYQPFRPMRDFAGGRLVE